MFSLSSLFSSKPSFDEKWLEKVYAKDKPFDILVKHPNKFNEHKDSEHTTLTWAVHQGDLKMVRALYQGIYGVNLLNYPGVNGRTPIQEAIHCGNLPIFIELLNHDAIKLTDIEGNLPEIFHQALREHHAGRLEKPLLINFLTSKVKFKLPKLTDAEKSLIYNDKELVDALMARRPLQLDLLKYSEENSNGNALVEAIIKGNVAIAKSLLANEGCKEPLLNTKHKGLTLLELALTTSNKSLEIVLALVAANAEMSQDIYKQLTDLSEINIEEYKQHYEIRNASSHEHKSGPTLRDELPVMEVCEIDALAIVVKMALDKKSVTGEDYDRFEEYLERCDPGTIKDLHEKRLRSFKKHGQEDERGFSLLNYMNKQEGETVHTFLSLYRHMSDKFLKIVSPASLAKLYYQRAKNAKGELFSELSDQKEKKAYITRVTPFAGFFLLKEHFQTKLEDPTKQYLLDRNFTSSSQDKLDVFCAIIHYLLDTQVPNKSEYERFFNLLKTFKQHDFPYMFQEVNKLSIIALKKHATEVDKAIRAEAGPLKVKYLQAMDRLLHKEVKLKDGEKPFTSKSLKTIFFTHLCKDIQGILKKYNNTGHTWLTYGIAHDDKDMVKNIFSEISQKEDKVAAKELLASVLNAPNADGKIPLREALDQGNLPLFVYLLQFEETAVTEEIVAELPKVFMAILHACQAGSLDRSLLVDLLKTRAEFNLPKLSRQEKLFIYDHVDVLHAVLDKKPPECEAFKGYDQFGHNVLFKAIKDGRLNTVKKIIEHKQHAAAFLNEPVLNTTPLEFAKLLRKDTIVLAILSKNPTMSRRTYEELTNIFNYDFVNYKHYQQIRDACNETPLGKSFFEELSEDKKNELQLFDRIFRNVSPSHFQSIRTEDFKDIKPGSIRDIHLKRFYIEGEQGYSHTPLYLLRELPWGLWPEFMKTIEPRSLARLYFQKAEKKGEEPFSEIEQLKTDFVNVATKQAGFFLLYEHFQDDIAKKGYMTEGKLGKLDIFCNLIYYLQNTLNANQKSKEYLNLYNMPLAYRAQNEFPRMLDALRELKIERLKEHALAMDKFILQSDAGIFKARYMQAMDKAHFNATKQDAYPRSITDLARYEL